MSTLRRILAATSASLALGACTVGPNFAPPQTTAAMSRFTPRPGSAASALSDAEPSAQWWKMFGDPVLDGLEEKLSAQNLDLLTAQARVDQSRALTRIAGAQGLPTVDGVASYQRQRSNPNGANGVPAAAGSPSFDLYQAGVEVGWELDLWGRARRTREAARALQDVAVEDQRFVLLSVQAEVARNYLALRGSDALLDILRDNLRIARDSARMARSRFNNGVTTQLDVADAEADVASIEAAIPAVEAAREQQANALSLLLGAVPGALSEDLARARALPAPPRDLPVGVPSQLLQRRPDVRGAEAALHAATAQIGVAKADFYPRISLTGSLASEALQLSSFGSWSSRQMSVGPTMTLPIFEGGRLKGALDLRNAQQQEAAVAYRRTVLTAWHEVDNAMTALAAEGRRSESLGRAVDESGRALEIAQRRYKEGAIDFLNVLSAQKTLSDRRRELIASQVATSQNVIGLYKALGGGWDAASAPEA